MVEVLATRPAWLRTVHPVGAVKSVEELRSELEAGHQLWCVLKSGTAGAMVDVRVDEHLSGQIVEYLTEKDEIETERRETFVLRFQHHYLDSTRVERRSRTTALFNLDGDKLATCSFIFRREEYLRRYLEWLNERR